MRIFRPLVLSYFRLRHRLLRLMRDGKKTIVTEAASAKPVLHNTQSLQLENMPPSGFRSHQLPQNGNALPPEMARRALLSLDHTKAIRH